MPTPEWVTALRDAYNQDVDGPMLAHFIGKQVKIERPGIPGENDGEVERAPFHVTVTVVGFGLDIIDTGDVTVSRPSLITDQGQAIPLYTDTTFEPVVEKLPEEWAEEKGIEMVDPDGWRGTFTHRGNRMEPKPYDEPILESEFMARLTVCTYKSK